jgi:hypothetical protein
MEWGHFSAGLTTAWNHELLRDYGRARATFAEYGDLAFSRTGTFRDENTATLALSLTARTSERFAASLSVGADKGRHSRALWGGIQGGWSF